TKSRIHWSVNALPDCMAFLGRWKIRACMALAFRSDARRNQEARSCRARRSIERVAGFQAGGFLPRFLRPAVLGIAALHLLSDVRPRAAPEARQIAGCLNRAAGRAGQLEQQRRIPDQRVGIEPEQRLHPNLYAGSIVAGISDGVVRAGGRDEFARGKAVEPLALVPRKR